MSVAVTAVVAAIVAVGIVAVVAYNLAVVAGKPSAVESAVEIVMNAPCSGQIFC